MTDAPHVIRLPELLSYKDIAGLAQVPERSVRRWVADGQLPAHQLGRHRRIHRDDWESYLRSRRVTRDPA